MKKRHLSLLLLLLDCFSIYKVTMARHAHHPSSCLRCPAGYGVSRPCSRLEETECSRCAPGRSYSAHASARRPCYPCSRCGAGLYVAHPCTPERDTVCDSCHTYRGPHNEDFLERCVRPLQPRTDPSMSESSVNRRSSPQTSALLIGAGAATVALALGLLLAAAILYSRRRCKTEHRLRYPYHAVATHEAVML